MKAEYVFDAIGTQWIITAEIPEGIDGEKTKQDILSRIAIFDKDYSRFRSDSLVSEIAKKAGTYTLPDDAKLMMALYKELYKITDGAFTPLIGQTLSDAGYDAKYSFKPGHIKKTPKWEDALDYKHPILKTSVPVLLDFGAAGKGYLVDIVSELLLKKGIKIFVVNAGGDIRVCGEKVRIGLEHPQDTSLAIGVASIANKSICGSAGNRRVWDRYHHIINPHTLTSPKNIIAAWVVADTAMLADGLTTCLYFVSPEELSKHFKFEYMIIFEDNSIESSQSFPAELFLSGN